MYKFYLLIVFVLGSAGFLHAADPNKENCQTDDSVIVNVALLEAAKDGDLDCVDRFTEPDFDVNMTGKRGEYADKTPLMVAAMSGKIEVVRFLHEKRDDLDVDKVDGEDKTALFLAVEEGHREIATFLAPLSEDINKRYGSIEVTVLHHAIGSGDTQLASYFLGNKGIDINAQNKDGDTPLMWAAARGQVEIVHKILNNRSVDIGLENNRGLTARYMISTYNVESMRNRQAILDMFNQYEGAVEKLAVEAEFITAAKQGNLSRVQSIFAAKQAEFDINKKESLEGSTALISAIAWERPNTARWLLAQSGIDVNLADNRGNTPLMHAVIVQNEELFFEIVHREDIKVHHKNQEGLAAIDIAEKKNNSRIVTLLRDKIDRDNAKLFRAVERGNVVSIANALDTGIDINARKNDGAGKTALITAAGSSYSKSNTTVLNTLLAKSGIDVNKQSNGGVTPIMAAVSQGNEAAANMLLRVEGIDLSLKNNQGETVFDLAQKSAVPGIVTAFEERSQSKGFSLRGVRSFFKGLFK